MSDVVRPSIRGESREGARVAYKLITYWPARSIFISGAGISKNSRRASPVNPFVTHLNKLKIYFRRAAASRQHAAGPCRLTTYRHRFARAAPAPRAIKRKQRFKESWTCTVHRPSKQGLTTLGKDTHLPSALPVNVYDNPRPELQKRTLEKARSCRLITY